MNQSQKTLTFVVTAAVLGISALGTHFLTRPKPIEDYEKVGTEFYPDFKDSTLARSLEVKALDPETGNLQEFKVEYENGLWRIPSHHGYPAEAADRLAQTAVSLIGVTRESRVAGRENQFELYGVVDPESDEAADAESVGKRVTLRDANGDILADYIIGNPAGSVEDDAADLTARSEDEVDDFFYVRAPGERDTYKAKINIDLSTRFSDWIEPDLLKIASQDLRTIQVDNYEFVQQLVNTRQGIAVQKQKLQGEIHTFNKADELGPWTLEGLNENTEELNVSKVNDLVSFLDEMQIAGVRPKLKYNGQLLITPDFQLNEIPELMQDRQTLIQEINKLQADLEEKGFELVAEDESGEQLGLAGVNGQVTAITDDAVVYTLYLGKLFLGDDDTIEIGGEEQPVEDADADTGDTDESGDDTSAEDPTAEEPGEDMASGQKKSRFVAIRVQFDPEKLGPKPVEPVEPTKPEPPEGYEQWKEQQAKEAAEQAAEESNKSDAETENDGDDAEAGDSEGQNEDSTQQESTQDATSDSNEGESAGNDSTADKTGDGQSENSDDGEQQESQDDQQDDTPPSPPEDVQQAADEQFVAYERALGAYTSAMQQYRAELSTYESEVANYNEREAAGKETAEQLGARFAEWYYVVSADELAKLRFERSELISPKEPESQPPTAPGNLDLNLPPRPDIQFDQGTESSDDSDAGEDESADDATAADDTAFDDNDSDDAKSDDATNHDDGN